MKRTKWLIVCIDPGTGSSSPTGFAVFDPITKDVFYAAQIGAKDKELHHRIKKISDIFEATLLQIVDDNPDKNILVCIESFVMRGKGGESLQRLIGSFIGRLPFNVELTHVQNVSVKLILAGHGHADKESVAEGVAAYFQGNQDSSDLIKKLRRTKEYDVLDSLAIGITGWQKYQQQKK